MKFFKPNIETKGRILRALIGLLFLAGASLAFAVALWLAAILTVAALFVLFEALRGWCVLRACGIKTRH